MDRAPADVFAAYRDQGSLAFPVDDAGRPVWPPTLGARNWCVSDGAGTVHAHTRVHPRSGDPYDVALVELDDGFRVLVRGLGPIGRRCVVRFEGDVPVA